MKKYIKSISNSFSGALLVGTASAAITPIDSLSSFTGAPGSGWTAISYNDPNLADPSSDQQTGGVEGDLVGNSTVPFFYTAFDNNSTTGDLRDGTLSFRTRHGGDSNPAGFEGALSVGIDANNDGKIDGYVGVNNSGSADGIYFWEAATTTADSNTSVSTLEFGSIQSQVNLTAANYNYREVVTGDLGAGVTLDVDGDAGAKPLIDTYLSFSVSFGDLLTLLEDGIFDNSAEVVILDENSNFRYIVGTSKQGNNFNQDTGGLNGITGEGILFSDPNAPISDPFTPTGTIAIPEPSSITLLLLSGAGLLHRRRRQQ